MTEIELKYAIQNFKIALEGKKKLLECLCNYSVQEFLENNSISISEERINAITEDEILRKSFLSVFKDTKESNNLMVYINRIQRTNKDLNDGQFELESINWSKDPKLIPDSLNQYNLYCDLETNKPILIEMGNNADFWNNYDIFLLPNYNPITEKYYYNSNSLDWVTKGYATIPFNNLQLFYFRQILETSSSERAVSRMKKLNREELKNICLRK